MVRIRRLLFLTGSAALILLLAVGYWRLPQLIETAVVEALGDAGFSSVTMTADRPELRQWRIAQLQFRNDEMEFEIEGVHLVYRLFELLDGSLSEVSVDDLSVTIHRWPESLGTSSQPQASMAETAGALLTDVPLEKLHYKSIRLQVIPWQLHLTGEAKLNLRTRDANIRIINPNTKLDVLTLTASLDAAANAAEQQLVVDSTVTAKDDELALIARFTGLTMLDGTLQLTQHLRLRWSDQQPFAVSTARGGGEVQLTLTRGNEKSTLSMQAQRADDDSVWAFVSTASFTTHLLQWASVMQDVVTRQAQLQLEATGTIDARLMDKPPTFDQLLSSMQLTSDVTGTWRGDAAGFEGSATLHWRNDTADILLDPNAILTWESLMVTNPKPAQLRYARATDRLQFNDIELISTELALPLADEPLRLTDLALSVHQGALQNWQSPVANSRLTLRTQANYGDLTLPLAFQAMVDTRWPSSTIELQWLDSSAHQLLPARIVYNADSEQGSLHIDHRLGLSNGYLLRALPVPEDALTIDAGTLSINGSWNLARVADEFIVKGEGKIGLDQVSGNIEAYALTNLTVEVPTVLANNQLEIRPFDLRLATLDVGMPINDITARIERRAEQWQLSGLTGQVLGGRFQAEDIVYPTVGQPAKIIVDLTGLSLTRLLALEGDDIRGQGTLDGNLPITLTNNGADLTATIAGGKVYARPPGGQIEYPEAAQQEALANQVGLAFALSALEDFHYDKLEIAVDYANLGDLSLTVLLQGNNPGIENGRPIHYNLSITENLPTLLESLRLSERVTEQVEDRVNRAQ